MSSSAAQEIRFSLLPKATTSWTAFGIGTGAQAVAVAFLVGVRLLYPTAISLPHHGFRSMQLVSAPVQVNQRPQPLSGKRALAANPDLSADALHPPAPQSKAPGKVEDASAPAVNIAPQELELLPLNSPPVIPQPAVITNVFSTPSSGTPIMARALHSRFTPERGTPGVAASSGFGNGSATAVNRPRPSSVAVQPSGFDEANGPVLPAARSHPTEGAAPTVPAKILSKPTPIYSQEARRLRIEGEVLLEVVLEASGDLRVVRVVRGLGHGLDDNAVRAAEQIHFRPAMSAGQPTDSTIFLHIIFQLA
ncbi:MAG: TonB family protein [Candidatus Sulfotelmatobacter sp.]